MSIKNMLKVRQMYGNFKKIYVGFINWLKEKKEKKELKL